MPSLAEKVSEIKSACKETLLKACKELGLKQLILSQKVRGTLEFPLAHLLYKEGEIKARTIAGGENWTFPIEIYVYLKAFSDFETIETTALENALLLSKALLRDPTLGGVVSDTYRNKFIPGFIAISESGENLVGAGIGLEFIFFNQEQEGG